MAPDDPYRILGVSPEASAHEIAQSYHRLALLYHPDRNPGFAELATARLRELNNAYELVGDRAQRRLHDSQSESGATSAPHESATRKSDDDEREILRRHLTRLLKVEQALQYTSAEAYATWPDIYTKTLAVVSACKAALAVPMRTRTRALLESPVVVAAAACRNAEYQQTLWVSGVTERRRGYFAMRRFGANMAGFSVLEERVYAGQRMSRRDADVVMSGLVRIAKRLEKDQETVQRIGSGNIRIRMQGLDEATRVMVTALVVQYADLCARRARVWLGRARLANEETDRSLGATEGLRRVGERYCEEAEHVAIRAMLLTGVQLARENRVSLSMPEVCKWLNDL